MIGEIPSTDRKVIMKFSWRRLRTRNHVGDVGEFERMRGLKRVNVGAIKKNFLIS
jgi:hypothetical protein